MATSTMLAHPLDADRRWSSSFEDTMRYQLAHRALAAAVGYVAYHSNDWENIADAVAADPAAAVRAFQKQIPPDEYERNIYVDDVQLLIVQGKEGPPPSGTPSDVTGTGWFANNKRHSASAEAALADLMLDGKCTRIFVHRFASLSLEDVLCEATSEVNKSQDTYLLELDRFTDCSQRTGKPPLWVSSAVLLKIRVGGCIVHSVTVSRRPDERLEVHCVSLGGREVAVVDLHDRSSCGHLRLVIARKLGITPSRLKLVFQDIANGAGALMKSVHDSMKIVDFISSAPSCSEPDPEP